MRTVKEYPLREFDTYGRLSFDIELPAGAKIVKVASQNGMGTIWAEVNTDAEPERRSFAVVRTGHLVPRRAHHVGTFFMYEERYVWHLYEKEQA